MVVKGEAGLHHRGVRRSELRARAPGAVEETGRRGQARSRVAVGTREHRGEAGRFVVFGGRRRLRLVALAEVVLHLRKLHLFATLGLLQLLHLHLEATSLLAQSLIFDLFLLDLDHTVNSLSSLLCIATLQRLLGGDSPVANEILQRDGGSPHTN